MYNSETSVLTVYIDLNMAIDRGAKGCCRHHLAQENHNPILTNCAPLHL